ncbi:MAG: hypothetical protein K2X50_03220 [Gammaproteobacteria bacterium]|nr:hypothetical protein [Gammaproteobacteria bacterium]
MFIVQSIFGFIALITSFIGFLPQSYKAYKTRSTHDISMLMVLNYLLCSLAWIVYGTFIQAGFVVASNIVCLLSSILLIVQKRYYDNAGR